MPKNKTYHNKLSASGKFDRKPLKPVFDTVIDFPPDVETERRRGAPDDDIFFHLLPGQLPCFRSHSINFPRVISRPTWDPIERRKTNWNTPARARNARKRDRMGTPREQKCQLFPIPKKLGLFITRIIKSDVYFHACIIDYRHM